MKKYVFITNSTKPSEDIYYSKAPIHLTNVSRPCLQIAKDMGYEAILGVNRFYAEDIKCDELDIRLYNANTYRSITAIKDNYIAYKNLCKILEEGNVEVIHCNTPIGGAIGRLCGKKYKIPKVIYTAHGFHFYKGAPLFNRTILKWAEHMMAHWTDVIITMNEEDYQAAQKMKLKKNGNVYKIPGVGIDTLSYQKVDVNKAEYRKELNLKEDDFVCISMGDLVKRKNYQAAIKAIAKCNDSKIHFLICGEGLEKENLINLSKKLNVEKQIHFLGFRKDIKELLAISDCFLLTSYQEGLPRSTMEAMASGLPCIVSKIRGNVDLIEDNINGFLVDNDDMAGISDKICFLKDNNEIVEKMSKMNLDKIKNYDTQIITQIIEKIYLKEI